MKLSGCTILDIYGAERIVLRGDYTRDRLAETMIENWVPYIECHKKCFRSDSCRYAPKIKNQDIRCGVVVEAIQNLVSATYSLLVTWTRTQIQQYLDGAYFLSQFILGVENAIGVCTNAECISSWQKWAPMLFGRLTGFRDYLNHLAENWKTIPELWATQHVLLVEGESERAFLDELRKSHFSWFLRLNVDVYGGKGNRRPRKIQMLLNRYTRQGYTIYAVGDADGANSDIFKKLVDSGLVKSENTFVFAHDFETSLPPRLLLHVLKEVRLISASSLPKCRAVLSRVNGSVGQGLKDGCSLDIGPHKVAIAKAAAQFLNRPDIAWWENDGFMERSELGRFLRFIQRIGL